MSKTAAYTHITKEFHDITRQATQWLTSHSKVSIEQVNVHCLRGLVHSRFGFASKPASIWILQLFPSLCTWVIASEHFGNCTVHTIV